LKLGEIQGVGIYQEDKKDHIWFVQQAVRWTTIRKLRRHKFKIAKELARKGYVIKDIEDFDNQLKSLLERKPKNQGMV
jgi:hypothetical protein